MRHSLLKIRMFSDADLTKTMHHLATAIRCEEAELLLYLNEMQHRALFAQAGYSSLFAYCLGELKFSEGTTCRRIAAARAVARFPEVMALVTDGSLHITALAMLEKHLTTENVAEITRRAVGCSKTQLEWLIAELAPKSDVKDSLKKKPQLPQVEHTGKTSHFPAEFIGKREPTRDFAKPTSVVQPTAPERVLIKCSASDRVAAKIKRVRELLAHKYPGGELEHILEEALEALLEKLAPERKETRKQQREVRRNGQPSPRAANAATAVAAAATMAAAATTVAATGAAASPTSVPAGAAPTAAATSITASPMAAFDPQHVNPRSSATCPSTPRKRYISADVKSEALRSSGGQCTYVSSDGRRCAERRALQFDHVQPFALGGTSTADNIRCYCRTHNAFAARQTFGTYQPRQSAPR